MNEIAYHNDKDHAVHIGNKTIMPGATRMVDESMLPNAHEQPKTETPESEPTLIDGTVPEITAGLPGLSDEELAQLEADEEEGNTRKGVMKAIAEEKLARADANQTDGNDGQSE